VLKICVFDLLAGSESSMAYVPAPWGLDADSDSEDGAMGWALLDDDALYVGWSSF
jgi:hypothetical protein